MNDRFELSIPLIRWMLELIEDDLENEEENTTRYDLILSIKELMSKELSNQGWVLDD